MYSQREQNHNALRENVCQAAFMQHLGFLLFDGPDMTFFLHINSPTTFFHTTQMEQRSMQGLLLIVHLSKAEEYSYSTPTTHLFKLC